MLRLLKQKNRQPLKKFSESFFQNPHHSWIERNPTIKRSFKILMECIEMEPALDRELSLKGEILFLPAHGKLACTIQGRGKSKFIMVFPDLIEIMYSAAPMRAVAVLAHELGHIHHRHGENPKNLSTLECQLEADTFAHQLGLGRELQEVLLDNGLDLDSRVRVAHLTSQIITEQN